MVVERYGCFGGSQTKRSRKMSEAPSDERSLEKTSSLRSDPPESGTTTGQRMSIPLLNLASPHSINPTTNEA